MASLAIGAKRPKLAAHGGVVILATKSLVMGVCGCSHLVDSTPYKFLVNNILSCIVIIVFLEG